MARVTWRDRWNRAWKEKRGFHVPRSFITRRPQKYRDGDPNRADHN
jgi:hypothetical protein